jgi:hypothetical protein
MTIALMLLLTAVAFWVLGHRTARVRVVVVGATAAQDEAALTAADEQLLGQWRAHLDQLTAPFDPDTTKDETP